MYSLDIEATSSSISVVQLRTCKFQFKNDKVSLVNPF
jgi:hypothetical protein